jgi:hypothetical protein
MKMHVDKSHKRALNRLLGAPPVLTRTQIQVIHRGWLTSQRRLPDSASPYQDGMLRHFWLIGHALHEGGHGFSPSDRRLPIPKRRRRLAS